MTQEGLILPYFPPAISWHHVEASLDIHWSLQITLPNPHGLEIQGKQSREGNVWPQRQDEREIHCTGTTAPHILLPAQLAPASLHIPLQYLNSQPDQWESGVIIRYTMPFWHIRAWGQPPCPSNWDRCVRVTRSEEHRTASAAADLIPKRTQVFLSGTSLSNLHSYLHTPLRKTFLMLQRCAWK